MKLSQSKGGGAGDITVMDVRFSHPLKINSPRSLEFAGMTALRNDRQSEKA